MGDNPKNPPAFPLKEPTSADDQGMTLRDYFAAAALTGIMANEYRDDGVRTSAICAYEMADAMLHERTKIDDK